MPEYIRPGTVSSTLAVTPAAVEVHNNVRWVNLIWGLKSNPQGLDNPNRVQISDPMVSRSTVVGAIAKMASRPRCSRSGTPGLPAAWPGRRLPRRISPDGPSC
jgi:hypothetical protein